MKRITALAVACMVIAIASAAIADVELPEIGDSAGGIVSPEQERRMGEAFLRQAHQFAVIVDDPEVETYFSGLGQQIAAQSDGFDGNFTFFLINHPAINAFAAPGGFVGAHTGLILASRSESEVAAVLAHEISHVTQRHGARSFEAASRMSLPMAAAMLGSILIAAANPEAGMAAITATQAAAQQYQLNFTRANEQEADRIGIQLMHRAEFDPYAMASFFDRLQQANRFTDPKQLPEYLRTHPVSINRMAEARDRADKLSKVSHTDSLSYHLVKAKLQVMMARDAHKALLAAEEAMRTGQYENETVARYRYAVALTEAREFGKARIQLQQLLKDDPERASFLLAIASKIEPAAMSVPRNGDSISLATSLAESSHG